MLVGCFNFTHYDNGQKVVCATTWEEHALWGVNNVILSIINYLPSSLKSELRFKRIELYVKQIAKQQDTAKIKIWFAFFKILFKGCLDAVEKPHRTLENVNSKNDECGNFEG